MNSQVGCPYLDDCRCSDDYRYSGDCRCWVGSLSQDVRHPCWVDCRYLVDCRYWGDCRDRDGFLSKGDCQWKAGYRLKVDYQSKDVVSTDDSCWADCLWRDVVSTDDSCLGDSLRNDSSTVFSMHYFADLRPNGRRRDVTCHRLTLHRHPREHLLRRRLLPHHLNGLPRHLRGRRRERHVPKHLRHLTRSRGIPKSKERMNVS